ncbi:MAG: glycosyltransferase family 4 protein [Bacteroidia bacterium]|nr:glycosyltransferase family 4 protein [Bacteroidia bacterium]
MKLRVLILIDWFLPGNKAGGPVKSIYSLIKLLNDKIDFYVITMNTDILSDKAYNVKSDEWTNYENIHVYYFSKEKFSVQKMITVIKDISPDVLYINSFWSFRFSIIPLFLIKFNLIKCPVVLAPRGMLEVGAMGIKSFKKKLFLFFSKILSLHKNVIFHSTSDGEKKSILHYYPFANVHSIQNLSYIPNNVFVSIEKKRKQLKLFFLSRISPIKNLDFAIHVLKKVGSTINDCIIEYDIYGNNEDKEYFKQCKELIKTLPLNIKVTYKGVVEFNEIPDIIGRYHFLFLPTKNENFGHAIVETLSCGRPVLISDCTPWNEINQWKCGYALPLDINQFTDAMNTMLMMENDEYQTMCELAQKFIYSKMNMNEIEKQYLKLFHYATEFQNN